MPTTLIHSNNISSSLKEQLTGLHNAEVEKRRGFHVIRSHYALSSHKRRLLSEEFKVDISILADGFTPDSIKLLITDMDSTLINIECVDEIADFLGIKPQVAAVTESAMRGEIDFNTSLNRRVSLLKNLSSDVLEEVYTQRLELNPGADKLITGLQAKGIKTALVSGGFTFFTEKLKQRLQLDFTKANRLAIKDNKLSGEINGEIVNAGIKAKFLSEICAQLGIDTSQSIAMGDGANDLEMMKLAGLGVAYRAKPKVQQQADVMLNYSGLDSVLDILNI